MVKSTVEKLPYAIQAQYGKDKHSQPHFLGKEEFLDLLYCNGTEDVNPDDFCEKAFEFWESERLIFSGSA